MQFEICLEALKVSAIIGILPNEQTKAQDLEVDLRVRYKVSESQNNPCEAPKSRPLRGAKNRIQGCSSATADFLLEAEKRGSPPKSEKAAAFWRVGGAGRGVQPFLREKTHESNKQNGKSNANSTLQHCDSCSLNSRDLDCFGESSDSPRNDESSADSRESTHPLAPSASEGEIVDYAILREIILITLKNNQFLYLENALVAIQTAILARFTQIITLDLAIKKLEIFSDCTPKVRLKWAKND